MTTKANKLPAYSHLTPFLFNYLQKQDSVGVEVCKMVFQSWQNLNKENIIKYSRYFNNQQKCIMPKKNLISWITPAENYWYIMCVIQGLIVNAYLVSVTRTWCHLYKNAQCWYLLCVCQTLCARNKEMKNMALAPKEIRN